MARISAIIPDKVDKQIRKLAEEDGRSLSDLIAFALETYATAREEAALARR